MKNTDTLDAPEQDLPTDTTPDPGLPPDDGPGVRGLSLSGIPAPFPPTTPIVGTNGGVPGTIAAWTGSNVIGNSLSVQDNGYGPLPGLNINGPLATAITLQSNGVTKLVLQAFNNAYVQAGAGAALLIGTMADGGIFFQQNSVNVFQILTSNQQSAFTSYVDNGAPIGLTGVTGANVTSPSYVAAYTFRPVSTRVTVNGSTSGSIIVTNPMSGSGGRKLIIQVQNLTGTATYPFSQAWSFLPGIFAPTAALFAAVTALTTGSVTITGTGTTGVIVLEGF